MSALASILIGVAPKVGAPIIKRIIEDKVGGVAGELVGVVIDAIAGKASVTPHALPTLPAPELEAAVAAVEADTPQLIAAWNEQQRETNRLMLAEMQRETAFGWLWRPAGMWLLLFCIAWYVVLLPLLEHVYFGRGRSSGRFGDRDLGSSCRSSSCSWGSIWAATPSFVQRRAKRRSRDAGSPLLKRMRNGLPPRPTTCREPPAQQLLFRSSGNVFVHLTGATDPDVTVTVA